MGALRFIHRVARRIMRKHTGSVWDRAPHAVGLSKCHFLLSMFVSLPLLYVKGISTLSEMQMVREGVEPGEGGLGGGLPWVIDYLGLCGQMPQGKMLCGSVTRRVRPS